MTDWQKIQLIRIQRRLLRAYGKSEDAKAAGYPEAYGTLAGAVEDVLLELGDLVANEDATAATVAE